MNSILTYFKTRDAGWLRKAAHEIKAANAISGALKKIYPHLGAGAAATAIGSLAYNIHKDRKINKMEQNRELVGAINDTMVRRSIGDIYGAMGYPSPEIPLAVSKEVSPEYKKVLEQMGKGAAEKRVVVRKRAASWLKPALIGGGLGTVGGIILGNWAGKNIGADNYVAKTNPRLREKVDNALMKTIRAQTRGTKDDMAAAGKIHTELQKEYHDKVLAVRSQM